MLSYFQPGTLVKADRPDFNVPENERHKVGLVVGHLPPKHRSHGYAVTMLLVVWTGPGADKLFSVEPDDRISSYV